MAGENRRALRYLRLLLFDLARESLTEDNEENEGFLSKKLLETWGLVGYGAGAHGGIKKSLPYLRYLLFDSLPAVSFGICPS